MSIRKYLTLKGKEQFHNLYEKTIIKDACLCYIYRVKFMGKGSVSFLNLSLYKFRALN